MKHLNESQLDVFRDLLLARETVLSDEIRSAIERRQQHENPGRAVDRGVLELEATLDFADVRRDQQELGAIHAALGRMDRGTYGRCLHCGIHISPERLRVAPQADLCQVCQAREEERAPSGPAA